MREGLLRRGKTSFGMIKRVRRSRRVRPVLPPRSAFAGFWFPREVIVLAVRWYLRYGLMPLTCHEIQHLLTKLITESTRRHADTLAWSRWRRCHQHRARACHYRRQQVLLG